MYWNLYVFNCRADTLLSKVSSTWNIEEKDIVIFSTMYPEYIGPHKDITSEKFKFLVETSGGWEGHAKLYVLSLEHIRSKKNITPDYSCLEALRKYTNYSIHFATYSYRTQVK